MVDYIQVKLWGNFVGGIIWDKIQRVAKFEYSPHFIRRDLEISPLKMPLQSNIVYSFPELNFRTYKGLPGLFADSLPDKFGNTLIDKWLSEQGREPDSFTPIERLLYLGKRGMGALEFEPAERISSNFSTRIELDGLINAARKALTDKRGLNTQLKDDHALLEILKVGTSAGGARPKAIKSQNIFASNGRENLLTIHQQTLKKFFSSL